MNPSLKLVLPAAGEWRLSLPQARLCPRGVNPSLNLNLKLVLLVSLLAPGSASQWRLSLPRARVPLLSGVSLLATRAAGGAGPSGVTPSLKLELQKYKSWQSRFISVLSSRSCTDARPYIGGGPSK